VKRFKYELKIDKREKNWIDPKGNGQPGVCKTVTVKAEDGRIREFEVDVKVLNNEELWDKFRSAVIEPWVAGLWIGG
jgi:hypothetical protein